MPPIDALDALTTLEWLRRNEAILIDVRELGEYREEHISYAHLLPLSQLTREALEALPLEGKKIIIHCRSGKRSMQACLFLREKGFTLPLWNMEGGILDWKAKGLGTES